MYLEPASDELVKRRFYGAGVDVFNDPGFFYNLPKAVVEKQGTGEAFVERLGGANYVYACDQYVYIVIDGVTTSFDAGDDIVNLSIAGQMILVSLAGGTTSVHAPADYSTSVGSITGYTGVPVMSYVKNRLMVSGGNTMWELLTSRRVLTCRRLLR